MYFVSIYPLWNFDHNNIIINKSTMFDHGLNMVHSDSLELSMVNHGMYHGQIMVKQCHF